jgi:hypothetical protein
VQPLIILIVTIVIISAVVGAIAQFLNKLNEVNAPPRRPPGPRPEGGAVRQSDKDMDRFLAEIDRLRRKNQEGTAEQPPAQARPVAPPPAPRPTRQPERPRPRVVAELAEPPGGAPRRRERTDAQGFTAPHAVPPSPPPPQTEELPVATVVRPGASTGAPATRVTTLPQRDRPTPKTDLAKNLTGLLNSGQGVAMAVILQSVLGPPRSKQR